MNVTALRQQFPILQRQVNDRPLVYLDNAATTQKPEVVLQTLDHFYRTTNANIHRGVHKLSQEATAAHDAARETVRAFIGARSTKEVVFTRGTTESINLVAQSWGRGTLRPGDEILITGMEHHSNIVPWQMVCQQTGAVLRVVPLSDRGDFALEDVQRELSSATRLLAVTWISNALGTINPVADLIKMAHAGGVPVLLDAAQAVAHTAIDVVALDCDFLAFSGHKVYGPTGIGVLYGRQELLTTMDPWQGGGDMILSVTFAKTEYNSLPYKFEAGTPDIAGAIGLAAALHFVEQVGIDAIAAHEADLLVYATRAVGAIPGVKIIGTAPHKAAVLSFSLDGVHPHDIGTILDFAGVAIRAGHHCAQPVMARFGIPATARASFAMYNTREEIDILVAAIQKVRELFA